MQDIVIDKLLQPIAKARVEYKPGAGGRTLAHVPTFEVIAHLIRIFGFCNFTVENLEDTLIFEQPSSKNPSNFDVCYKSKVRLTVYFDTNYLGRSMCFYDGVSTGDARNQPRVEAHDLALKTAASTALKRAAIHLGDQFGLSLYHDGQTSPVVRHIFPKNTSKQEKEKEQE